MAQLPDFKPKSFWERKEGTFGMVVAVVLGIIGVWGFSKLLPWIITLLENTLYAAGLGIVLFAVVWILTDKRFRTLVSYGYKSLMRWIVGRFVQLDPIGILKSYVEDLHENLGRMNKHIENLRGQMRDLKNLIDANARQMEQALKLAKKAGEEQKKPVFMLKARQAGRLKESNMTLSALYTKMEILYRVLVKMYETSEVLVEDMESEIEVKSRERQAILASHSAFRSAMKILKGDSDKKALFDQAMEYLAHDYGQKVGEIEHFVEMSGSFIESVDLQNGVYEEDALKMLEEWEKKTESILLGDQKKALVSAAYDENEVLDINAVPVKPSVAVEQKSKDKLTDYKNLFIN